MYVNGTSLLQMEPIKDMIPRKMQHEGSNTSYGLSELGYDIRLKQRIEFFPPDPAAFMQGFKDDPDCVDSPRQLRNFHGSTWIDGQFFDYGRFVLASAIEEFQMPSTHGAEVKDKSSNARKGIQVFNTVIEPGWKGFLTLEIAFWNTQHVVLEPGQGIAQVLFIGSEEMARYDGKYQNQPNRPVHAK